MPNNDEIGYGKPPKKTQFKPGQSGNPKGRPKGSKSLGSVVRKELGGKIQLSQNGKRKRVSKVEALVMRLLKDALDGKPRAQSEILKLADAYLPEDAANKATSAPTREEDKALIDAFVKRMLAQNTDGGGDDIVS